MIRQIRQITKSRTPTSRTPQKRILPPPRAGNEETLDVIIPCGPNDVSTVHKVVEHAKKHVLNHRNIYLITPANVTIEGCYTIPERVFPFGLNDVRDIHGRSARNGWYLQQMLKLYAGIAVEGILGTYLALDADTVLLKPIAFTQNDQILFNVGKDHHEPYFEHMKRLHPSLKKMSEHSGITHHMVFKNEYIKTLFDMVEKLHQKEFWRVFFEQVDEKERINENGGICSGASEYEIFFNFMYKYYPDKFRIRLLKYKDVTTYNKNYDCDYISCHWYMRTN